MTNYKSIVKDLQKHYSDASEVVIVNRSGKILYSTDNWNVKSDIKDLLSSWGSGNAQFVKSMSNLINFLIDGFIRVGCLLIRQALSSPVHGRHIFNHFGDGHLRISEMHRSLDLDTHRRSRFIIF